MAKGIYIGDEKSIARNVSAVYPSIEGVARKIRAAFVGDRNGKAVLCFGVQPIAVRIDNTRYIVDKGTTWEEWVVNNSPYEVVDGKISNDGGHHFLYRSDDTEVLATDEIIRDEIYTSICSHNAMSEWVVVIEPTYWSEGLEKRTCEACGDEYTRPIPMLYSISVGELEVGSSVFVNVDGVATEFIVVHQGNPDEFLYDNSCNGTWFLMKNIYTEMMFCEKKSTIVGTTYNYVKSITSSPINTYLNEEFFSLLDDLCQSVIREVRLPYVEIDEKYTANMNTYYGYDGYATKLFLLGDREVGEQERNIIDGSKLDYFIVGNDETLANERRCAAYNGENEAWWLRTIPRWDLPSDNGQLTTSYVRNDGMLNSAYQSATFGVRPAFILPGNVRVNENFNLISYVK